MTTKHSCCDKPVFITLHLINEVDGSEMYEATFCVDHAVTFVSRKDYNGLTEKQVALARKIQSDVLRRLADENETLQ